MKKQMTKIAGLGLCIFLLLVMISTAYADELTGEVKTTFVLTPENTVLEVYSKNGLGEKITLLPEADGSFVLLPGRYYYTATAEGYYSLEETEFILSDEQSEFHINLELQEIPIINSGTCGSGLTWKLDELGTLTITGNGRIRNYYSYNLPPWGTGVTKVLFSGNITGIGNYAFYDCDNLSDFTFPESILSIAEIQVVTEIACDAQGIADLRGIEFFSELTSLVCQGNQLTSLDVSNNMALTVLRCWDYQLTSLDVSHNPNLEILDCHGNGISALDVLHNPELTLLSTHHLPL